jgi:hypothetical protein
LNNLVALGAVEHGKDGNVDTYRLAEDYLRYCQNVDGIPP